MLGFINDELCYYCKQGSVLFQELSGAGLTKTFDSECVFACVSYLSV